MPARRNVSRVYGQAPAGCPVTARELAFLKLLDQGYTREEIRKAHATTAASVQVAICRARRKLGAKTDHAAVKAAREWFDKPSRSRYPLPPAGCLLSPAQYEFVRRQAKGQTLGEIERDLGLAKQTVNQALMRARRRLGIAERRGAMGLMLECARRGWLDGVELLEENLTATQRLYLQGVDRWLAGAGVEEMLGIRASGSELALERATLGRIVCREKRVLPERRTSNGTLIDALAKRAGLDAPEF